MSAPGHARPAVLLLAAGDADVVDDLVGAAARFPLLGEDIDETIAWAVLTGADIPLPGTGLSTARWSALATAGALDVTAARVLEPHVDALSILAEAQRDGVFDPDELGILAVAPGSSWGVFAAEGPRRLEAARSADGRWHLTGTKTWCSLAAHLSHALITAWVSPEERALFAVSLRDPTVTPHPGPWVSRGLSGVVSAPVDFDTTPAVPIGGTGWYLRRPGFAWGGMGVAAVWWGGAQPLRDALSTAAARASADQLAHALLGDADAASWGVRSVLVDAAHRIDGDAVGSRDPHDDDVRVLAERVRAVTAAGVERMLTLADHALGPGPLTTDEDYARRVADLRIYVRQHHAERDLARLGRRIVAAP